MLKLPKLEKSYRQESYLRSTYPQLSEDLKLDVVIIGGGTTGRNTGKVTSQHKLV
ncbi:hypothetical protein IPL85_01425 [Candidatus Saccharibacteria bacterium]|nr:MAG: hypothetical protein IPL85_01425 [Candidatus Saccharibacteria bacterium]